MNLWLRNFAYLVTLLALIIAAVAGGNYLKTGKAVPEWTVSWRDRLPGQKEWLVLRVVDGDSTLIRYQGKMTAVQLVYVQAPDKGQLHWEESRDALLDKIAEQRVEVRFRKPGVEERDFYGRLLAYLYLNGRNINREMIYEGMAKYREDDEQGIEDRGLLLAEQQAREENLGVWKLEENIQEEVEAQEDAQPPPK